MDNTTNIIYNIQAIDNATAVIKSVSQSLQALRKQSPVTIKLKTVYETHNKITNTVKDIYKAEATASATLKRTLVDTYKNVQTYQTNTINKNKTINEQYDKYKASSKAVKDNSEKTNSAFGKWSANLGRALARFLSIRKVMDFLVSAVNESAAWTENLHLFEVAFDSASDAAYDFAKSISRNFGTSINEVIRFTSVFRQMTAAIGIADTTATKMSQALTALGYDIASLYNLSIESAMEKLQAGIAGQTKPLRTLGMDITAQSLDNYIKQTLHLSNITSKQMTQADKMILRTIVIMEQAQNAYGDMAETINTFSNQVKVLQGSITNFKLAAGDLIKTYFKPLVSLLAGILIAITDIIRVFAPLEDTSGIDNLTNSLMGVEDELEDIAETAGLLSFDKFNALTKSGSASSDSITAILENAFGQKYEEYMKAFDDAMKSIKNDANQIALKIKEWIFPFADWDEETGELVGELGKVNGWLRSIWLLIKLIVAIKITSLLLKLPNALLNVGNAIGKCVDSSKALNNVWSSLAAFGFVYLLIDLITRWEELDGWGKTWRITLIAVCAVVFILKSGMAETLAITALFIKDGLVKMVSFMKAEVIPTIVKICSTQAGMLVGFAALATGIVYFISNLDKMSTTAKVLIPIIAALSAVFVGLAVAKAAAAAGIAAPAMAGITAAALTAGIVLAAGTAIAIGQYETGGMPPKGQLFIANEHGNPELVGQIGGKAAVANNGMIITALEEAAYRGFARAIDATSTGGSQGSTNKTIVLNLNGREVARAVAPDMADEFGRRNIKIKSR